MLICSWWASAIEQGGYEIIAAHPVNLIEVVRLEDVSADDAGSVGSSQLDIDMAKEYVEVTLDGGCITLLRDGELGT